MRLVGLLAVYVPTDTEAQARDRSPSESRRLGVPVPGVETVIGLPVPTGISPHPEIPVDDESRARIGHGQVGRGQAGQILATDVFGDRGRRRRPDRDDDVGEASTDTPAEISFTGSQEKACPSARPGMCRSR